MSTKNGDRQRQSLEREAGSLTATRSERLAYIADMIEELKALVDNQPGGGLSALLSLAQREAASSGSDLASTQQVEVMLAQLSRLAHRAEARELGVLLEVAHREARRLSIGAA